MTHPEAFGPLPDTTPEGRPLADTTPEGRNEVVSYQLESRKKPRT